MGRGQTLTDLPSQLSNDLIQIDHAKKEARTTGLPLQIPEWLLAWQEKKRQGTYGFYEEQP